MSADPIVGPPITSGSKLAWPSLLGSGQSARRELDPSSVYLSKVLSEMSQRQILLMIHVLMEC